MSTLNSTPSLNVFTFPTRLKALRCLRATRRMKEETEVQAVRSNTAMEQKSGKGKYGRGRARKNGQGQKRKVADRDPASVMSLKDKVREGSMWLRVLEKKTHSLSKAHKHKHILG